MPIRLDDALKHPSFIVADPVIRAGAGAVPTTQLRWIHSSEVLDIAPLLGGGELLLTGAQALAVASESRRVSYIHELAERGVAALAIETGPAFPSLPASMISAAEAAGFPLIELRRVVPFVTVMQAINSMLVSQSVSNLQRADEASHAMAIELAHGGSLDRILAVLAGITGATVALTSTTGSTLASAAPPVAGTDVADPERIAGEDARPISFDVPVRGIPSARLDLYPPPEADANLARVAGRRSVDILALALLQRMPPGLKEVSGAALLRAVDSGTQVWRLQQLAAAAGIPVAAPVVAVVIRSPQTQHLRGAVEHVLTRLGQQGASYVDNDELLALAVLRGGSHVASRSALLAGLETLDAPDGTLGAVGPLATGISQAPWSLSEARLSLALADDAALSAPRAAAPGSAVVDAESFAVERLTVQSVDSGRRGSFVRQQLGPLLDYDAQRNSQLLLTLATWLDSGCNTARAARRLHVERQSMHQRLQRIFELCGGDPRETGRLAALHLAARMAALR